MKSMFVIVPLKTVKYIYFKMKLGFCACGVFASSLAPRITCDTAGREWSQISRKM